jgi:hypothetical protein
MKTWIWLRIVSMGCCVLLLPADKAGQLHLDVTAFEKRWIGSELTQSLARGKKRAFQDPLKRLDNLRGRQLLY